MESTDAGSSVTFAESGALFGASVEAEPAVVTQTVEATSETMIACHGIPRSQMPERTSAMRAGISYSEYPLHTATSHELPPTSSVPVMAAPCLPEPMAPPKHVPATGKWRRKAETSTTSKPPLTLDTTVSGAKRPKTAPPTAPASLKRPKRGVLVLNGCGNPKLTRSFVVKLANLETTHSPHLEKLRSATAKNTFVASVCRSGIIQVVGGSSLGPMLDSGTVHGKMRETRRMDDASIITQTYGVQNATATATASASDYYPSTRTRVHLQWHSGFQINEHTFARIRDAAHGSFEFHQWLAETLFVCENPKKKEYKCVKTNFPRDLMGKMADKLGRLFMDCKRTRMQWSKSQKRRLLSEMAEERLSLLVAESKHKEYLFNDPFQQTHSQLFELYIEALFAQFIGAANFMTESQQQLWTKAEGQKKKRLQNTERLAKMSCGTPDILVAEDCELTVNGCRVRWIECKNFFLHSAKPFISSKIVKQLRKYVKAFGNGAIVSNGFTPEFERSVVGQLKGAVVFLDAAHLDIPSHYYY